MVGVLRKRDYDNGLGLEKVLPIIYSFKPLFPLKSCICGFSAFMIHLDIFKSKHSCHTHIDVGFQCKILSVVHD